jgi:O-antigen/teichoic acid export membrane protein
LQKLKLYTLELQNHQGFKKYFKNTSWLLIERIFRLMVSFFVGVWVIRYLGPEQYGLFSYAQSFVLLFAIIARLGIDEIIVKDLLKNPNKKELVLGTSFGLKLIGVVLILLLLVVGIFISKNDLYLNVIIIIIACANIFQTFNVIDFYFQSKVLSKFSVYSNLISLSISAILKITFVLLEMPLMAFVILFAFDALVLALGLIFFYCKQGFSIYKWHFSLYYGKKILKQSWPIIISSIFLMMQARIDQIMIKEFLGFKELGYYSTALRLVEVVAFFPIILKSSFYPAIQNAKKKSEQLYQIRLLNFYRLNFFLFLLVAIPIAFFSEFIIELIFGTQFLPAAIILKIMAIRLFFANMGTARGIYILSENLFKFSLLTTMIGTITNFVLNLIWIKSYGAVGAIYATIISYGVTIFIIDLIYIKTRYNTFLMFKGMFSFYKIKIQEK